MGFRKLVGGVLVLLMGTAASAGAMGIEAAVGGWIHEPRGTIADGPDSLNLESELRYDKETRITGRVKIETPLFFPNIYLMATPMEFEGDGTKDANFTFGDVTFNANVPFTSKVTLDHYDVGLYWGVPLLKTATAGILNVDLGLNARIIDLKSEINQPTTGFSQSDSVVAPIPMVYAGVQVKPVSWFALEGEGRGITYSKNHYFDLIARGKLIFFDHVFAAAGYRYEKVDIDQDDIRVDTNFGGPFAEVGFQF